MFSVQVTLCGVIIDEQLKFHKANSSINSSMLGKFLFLKGNVGDMNTEGFLMALTFLLIFQ